MQIFNFAVLSVIITSHNVLTPQISKTHLPIVSLNVRELESWIDAWKLVFENWFLNRSFINKLNKKKF